MTATAAVRSGKIAALRTAYEAAASATREAHSACDRAQAAHDEAAAQLRALRAERKAAPDGGASVAQLRAFDSRIAEAERRLEVGAAELRRIGRADNAARKAEDEARRKLEASLRRARELPGILRDVQSHVRRRRSELADAERVVAAIGGNLREYEALLAGFEAELAELGS